MLPSKKQEQLLEFIDGFIKENNYAPSYREVMRALDYKSVSTVAKHIDGLIERGWLEKRENSKRSLEVIYKAAGQAAAPKKSPALRPRLSEEELQQRLEVASRLVEVGAQYEHFKGGLYMVTNLVIQTVDDEVCVVYRAEYGAGITFARPLTEWVERVEVDGRRVGRFEKIEATPVPGP